MDDAYTGIKRKLGSKVRLNVVLAPYTTFKIGGPADAFYEAATTEQLVEAMTAARQMHVPAMILGGGSNILVGDRGFRGLVIRNTTRRIVIRGIKGSMTSGASEGNVYVEADSGVSFNYLVRFTIGEGLGGLEMHLGLPGSVGGAVFMNSKWMHARPSYVGDSVYQARLLKTDNTTATVPREYFHFRYGKSVIQTAGDIILSVVFVLERKEKSALWKTADESIAYRRKTQPQAERTAGCVFKNISEADAIAFNTPDHTTSAGYLIDHSGCKGMSAGGAKISDVHANFIVNTGRAKACDVIQLIDAVRSKVAKKFGITLSEEIIRIGEF